MKRVSKPIDWSLTVPPSLYLTNIEDIKQLECTWDARCNDEQSDWWCMDDDIPKQVYSTYKVSDELHTWVQQSFDFDVIVNYQIMHGQIPVHTDYGRSVCWNYIIDTGGTNITTRFWNLEETEIIEEIECKLHEWYELDVSQKHDVSNVEGYRIVLTVFEVDSDIATRP